MRTKIAFFSLQWYSDWFKLSYDNRYSTRKIRRNLLILIWEVHLFNSLEFSSFLSSLFMLLTNCGFIKNQGLIKLCRNATTLLIGQSEKNQQKDHKGVINDPLGQTHSHASSEHCFQLFCFFRFEKWGRTDNMCDNNDPYRPWLWVGRVDQQELIQCFLL